MKFSSDEHKAAHEALSVNEAVTYPSVVSAQRVRAVLRDLLREFESLHALHIATCSAYASLHAKMHGSPPCFAEKNDGVFYVCRCAKCRG